MKIKTKLAAWLLALSLVLSCTAPAMAQEPAAAGESAPAVQENLKAGTSDSVTEGAVDGTETAPAVPVEPKAETTDAVTEASENDQKTTANDGLVHWKDLKALGNDLKLPVTGEDAEEVTQIQAIAFLLLDSGLADSQLGKYPSDYEAMADSMGLLPKGYQADAPCTQKLFDSLKNSQEIAALKDAVQKEKPLFLNGMAQPVFPYTPGTDADYSNANSDIIRYCVYVETNHDTDGDGKLDLVKALVQLPKAAAEGSYQAATIYEARPYITGCTDNMEDHYAEGELGFDMYATPPARVKAGEVKTMEHAATASSSDWYYLSPFESSKDEAFMSYEDLEWYDSYLVRGFAVVEVGGLGTRGSEGFETCGSDLEIDAFKCVIEWLTGDRVAYTDKTSNIAIKADWSNGKVGMTGRSYAGTTQFGLASTGVKGLETIVPVAGIASWYDYTDSQGVHTRWSPAYTNHLAAFCTGRYLDSVEAKKLANKLGHADYTSNGDFETIREKYEHHLYQMKQEQLALNGDYGDHWAKRDYTTSNKFHCSALIVHGLNDYNVRPKHFDMMYRSFRDAGQNVKLLLHQDGHLTPTYPSAGLAFDIGEQSYDEILNRWFSHYLYGLNNGAENMAAVTAEDSHSAKKWHTYDSWETAASLFISGSGEETATITSDDAEAGINSSNWKEIFANKDTAGNVRYTMELAKDTVIKGVSQVSFKASVNNAEALPAGTALNRDNLMVSAMLVDIAPEGETFPVFHTEGAYVPKTTLEEGGAWMGGGLKNMDLTEHKTVDVSYNVITRGWMDLCNPNAGYTSASAARTDRVELKAGENHNYTIYLQPTVYEVPAGHTLALVLYADEPDMGSGYDQQYTITVDQNSVKAKVPVDGGFSDVAAGVYYQDAVQWAVSEGITNGLTDTVFAPHQACTRAQAVTFLWRSMGAPAPASADNNFADVAENAYYRDAVLWAVENGLTNGTTANAFSPNQTVTRAQFMTFLWRLNDSHAATQNAAFTDVSVNAYYSSAVQWAVSEGITNGTTATTFSPNAPCTRGQIVTFLWRSAQ